MSFNDKDPISTRFFSNLDASRIRRYAFPVIPGLRADPVPWLLEEDNPSVRYGTLVDLLDASPRERRVTAARRAIMEKGTVPKILAKQNKGGPRSRIRNGHPRSSGRSRRRRNTSSDITSICGATTSRKPSSSSG
jgi:hypothetical protein